MQFCGQGLSNGNGKSDSTVSCLDHLTVSLSPPYRGRSEETRNDPAGTDRDDKSAGPSSTPTDLGPSGVGLTSPSDGTRSRHIGSRSTREWTVRGDYPIGQGLKPLC